MVSDLNSSRKALKKYSISAAFLALFAFHDAIEDDANDQQRKSRDQAEVRHEGRNACLAQIQSPNQKKYA